ncbi:hypothetical protein [Enterovibrio norvegicus]|uniref:hypothetical protein n=1 Tax=Enterovibrio norvegicus TaxID=188144 RepID=UPI00352EA93F
MMNNNTTNTHQVPFKKWLALIVFLIAQGYLLMLSATGNAQVVELLTAIYLPVIVILATVRKPLQVAIAAVPCVYMVASATGYIDDPLIPYKYGVALLSGLAAYELWSKVSRGE